MLAAMSPLPTDPRVAVITGANRGIGLAAARRLGTSGVHVVLACRDAAKSETVAAGLRQEGLCASSVQLDPPLLLHRWFVRMAAATSW
jgi:NAD(P)-dependent dehydrogenase (short-subunit alcohol dehydrogenase family)